MREHAAGVNYQLIKTDAALAEFCEQLRQAPEIVFDTEFVAEFTYRPQLCLIQVATRDLLGVIDPFEVDDISIFWRTLAEGDHETVVHAGREEILFCFDSVGQAPANLFDVQIAAGLIGLEYPASLGKLLHRLLNKKVQKHETRTDWRRRPLSKKQTEYALDDVRYLLGIRDKLHARLSELGRVDWLRTEIDTWQQELMDTRTRERWRRVSGSSGLNVRSLAIVRELWRWREEYAASRDMPVRKILRDDLIVELAKRQNPDPNQMRMLRGMERGDLRKVLPDLQKRIETALALDDSELPTVQRRESTGRLTMVGQFLSAALSSICHAAEVSPGIVGTASDVRELIAFRLGQRNSPQEEPLLTQGWRAEVVGQLLDDLLAGRKSIRIEDPLSEHPLIFDPAVRDGDQDGKS